MKVTLTKDQAIGEYADLEEVQRPEVFGVMKRPEDPPIKSLLTWDLAEGSPKQKTAVRVTGKWMTEMRDSYRGFFFSEDKRKLYRLKEEDTPSFDPSSLAENSKERTLTSLKVTARDIPKEESGLIDSSFDAHQSAKPSPPVLTAAEEQVPKAPGEIPIKPDLSRPAATPGETKKPTKRQERPKTAARAKSATPQDDDAERKKRQEERIKKLHQTTRWLPNSAFTTYYGKPPFCAYGQGNVNPTVGGIMYGNYLATHNIAAHEGANNPMYQQVYETAEMYASKRPPKSPEPPRKCKDEDRLNPEQVRELKARSQITGKARTRPSKPIVKPDLLKAKTFQSVHSTPNLSRVEGEIPVARKSEVPETTPHASRPHAEPHAPIARPVDPPTPRLEEQPVAATKPVRPQTAPVAAPTRAEARPEQVVHLPAAPEFEEQPIELPLKHETRDEAVQIETNRGVTSGSLSQRAQPTPSLIPLSPALRMENRYIQEREDHVHEELPPEANHEECEKCLEASMRNLQYLTAYKEMTGKVPSAPEVPAAEPFRTRIVALEFAAREAVALYGFRSTPLCDSPQLDIILLLGLLAPPYSKSHIPLQPMKPLFPQQFSVPAPSSMRKPQTLQRGFRLFNSLFPPVRHSTESQLALLSPSLPPIVPDHDPTTAGEATEKSTSPRLRRAVTCEVITDESVRGIEKELDAEAKFVRRRPARLRTNQLPRPVQHMQATPLTASSSKDSISPAVTTEQPHTAARKLRAVVSQTVYLNLPPLPFGSHISYNDVESIRSMLTYPGEEQPSKKKEGKATEKCDTIEPQSSDLRMGLTKDKHEEYIRKADLVLISRKKTRKVTLPARLFKNVYDL